MSLVMNSRSNFDDKYDYYATNPIAVEKLLEVEKFSNTLWEPCCGEGHISKVLKKYGYEVISSDIVDRGYEGTKIIDFLQCSDMTNKYDIITNPPYNKAFDFCKKAIELSKGKVAMFLKLTFLETKKRKENLFNKYPPSKVYVFSERVECAKNGKFEGKRAVCYAWFIWEKDYEEETIIKWL